MDRRVDKYPTIQAYAADDGYRGTAVQHAQTQQGRFLEVVVGLTGPYVPMAKRWVVYRTFGWMPHSRRLAQDYEIIPGNSENMVRISRVKIMLEKLI
ncbi:IS5 family transposase domain protein [Candidatus Bealeia paramacronuclearis]|uniref:IS5 family transposase domain protein n=1 Tax=Candidatus Bealeia paramacronuclearis TaxID=1921001 RepID=A0ABZ2C513_9PROT|nr:IS5 family transposase domain protein [Candidatus Bealeia paramacronuclearis]